jgi:D-alanyl-D-alanine endopeptidase (penicillin-binding protein 7)
MFRIISRIVVLLATLIAVTCFCLVQPANLSTPPGLEGPPLPPPLELGSKVPRVYCQAAILIDNGSGQTLYGRNEYCVRPIASITKLLTALTFLDFQVDWDSVVVMTRADAHRSSRSRLRAGDGFRVRDLFHAALLSSDNRAARALSRSTGLEMDSFVVCMNNKARELGLLTMKVVEPTGLSEKNVASAVDCAALVNAAAKAPAIKKAMRTRVYDFTSIKRKRKHRLVNTNRLLLSRWFVEGGKTGYIYESGWCVAVRASDWHNKDLTAVVLGASSKTSRFTQASKLFRWGFRKLRELEA